MSYEIDMPVIKELLKETGRSIKKTLPAGWGFTLMLYEYGDNGALFYVSSAEREDSLKMIQEWMDKMKNDPKHQDLSSL